MHGLLSVFTTYLPYFVLVLTLLVFVHEFGHYWVGRWFGIHAEVFSIGFGPELFGWTDRSGTRWKISAIPLGGYVKFLGDNDATSATPSAEPLAPEQQRRAFFNQPLYARAAVVLGGPLAHLVFPLPLAARLILLRGRAVFTADGRRAGWRTGGQGRPAHGRRDRSPGRPAHRSLRGHPGVAVSLLGQADGGRIPPRQPAAEHRDRAAILRAYRQVQQHAALRRTRHGPACPPGRRRLRGEQPGRGGGVEGRRPAARNRWQAGRLLLAYPGIDRQPRRPAGGGEVRS